MTLTGCQAKGCSIQASAYMCILAGMLLRSIHRQRSSQNLASKLFCHTAVTTLAVHLNLEGQLHEGPGKPSQDQHETSHADPSCLVLDVGSFSTLDCTCNKVCLTGSLALSLYVVQACLTAILLNSKVKVKTRQVLDTCQCKRRSYWCCPIDSAQPERSLLSRIPE